jgi:hypothetical protein
LITSPRLDLGFLVRFRRKIFVFYAANPFIKRGTFSPDWLVPVVTTGTKGLYQPGLKAVFLLVWSMEAETEPQGQPKGDWKRMGQLVQDQIGRNEWIWLINRHARRYKIQVYFKNYDALIQLCTSSIIRIR